MSYSKRHYNINEVVEYQDVTQLQAYIAVLVENAFLAGRKSVEHDFDCSCDCSSETSVGEALVKARNYVKDKGLRL